MNKMVRRSATASLAVLLLVIAGTSIPVHAATGKSAFDRSRKVTFHILMGWSKETDSQFGYYMKEVFDGIMREMKMNGTSIIYKDEGAYFKAVDNDSGYNFAIVGTRDNLVKMLRDHRYRPFFSASINGMKKNRVCLFVDKRSRYETLGDIRGKAALIYDEPQPFIEIWNKTGVAPDKYFKSMEVLPSGISVAYKYSLGENDVAIMTDQIYFFLKINNPAIIKSIRRLDCMPEYTFLPIMYKSDMPQPMLDEIWDHIGEIEKGKLLKESYSLMKLQRLKFERVKPEWFVYDIKYFTAAEKNGQMKHYREWRDRVDSGKK